MPRLARWRDVRMALPYVKPVAQEPVALLCSSTADIDGQLREPTADNDMKRTMPDHHDYPVNPPLDFKNFLADGKFNPS